MELSEAAGLRAISDAFIERVKVITEMEERKRELSPTDPAFLILAEEVEDAVRLLLENASEQREASWEAHDSELHVPINQIPPGLSAAELLSRWRSYEHELALLEPLSAAAHAARVERRGAPARVPGSVPASARHDEKELI